MAAQLIEQATAGARIGPNAVIQTVNALTGLYGHAGARQSLAALGQPELIDYRPAERIDEREFLELYHGLLATLGPHRTCRVMARAGELTGQYVIQNAMPGPVQRLLHMLPRGLALRMLLSALGRYAWVFAGSGQFGYSLGRTPQLTLTGCITARGLNCAAPTCTFYQSAFQELLATLIDGQLRVREIACEACGAARCEFQILL